MEDRFTYNQVVQQLKLMSTEKVNEATKELQALTKTNPDIFRCLHLLLQNNQIETWARLIAASYINTAYCDQLFCIDRSQQNDQLIAILKNPSIHITIKRTLERCIIQMIDNLQEPYLTQFREIVVTMWEVPELQGVVYLLIGCFCIPELQVCHYMYFLQLFLNPTLNRMILFDQSAVSLQMADQYNQILKTWSLVWDAILPYATKPKQKKNQKEETNLLETTSTKQFNLEAANLLADVANSQPFSAIILQIYQWCTNQAIYFCCEQSLVELNMLKNNAAELHTRMLEFVINNKLHGTTCIQKLTEQIMPSIMKNLMIFAAQRQALQAYETRDFTTSLIKIMRLYVQLNPAYFAEYWKQIFSLCIIPLLKINQEEMVKFEEEKDEFIALFQDCSECQKFGIVKSEISKLLEIIGENESKITQQEFILNFIIQYAVDSICEAIGVNTQRAALYQNQGLPVTTFESALLILSIFSFTIDLYTDSSLKQLAQVLNKQNVMKLPPLDRCRLYSYLGYNFGQTYLDKDNGAFLVELALLDNGHPTVEHSAIDFLSNIADEYYSDFFLEGLVQKVSQNQNTILWDAIEKLIRSQYTKMNYNLLIRLSFQILGRIRTEFEVIKDQELKETQHIAKLVQILQTITGFIQHFQTMNHASQLKQAVWAIMGFLKALVDIDMEDQALKIVLTFLKYEKELVQNHPCNLVIPQLLECFKANEYQDLIYYRLFNHYIMKNTYCSFIDTILNFIYSTMMSHLISNKINKNKTKYKVMFGNFLVLMQNCIVRFGPSINKEQLIQISCITTYFLPSPPKPNQQIQIYDKILLGRALNLMILFNYFVPIDGIWNLVNKYYPLQVFYGYDMKVLMVCLRKQILSENEVQKVASFLVILMKSVDLYQKRKLMETKALKIREEKGKSSNKSRIKVTKDHDYAKFTKTIETPFSLKRKLNYQSEIKDILNQLKNKSNEAFNQLYNQFLNKEEKQLMNSYSKGTLLTNGERRVIYNIGAAKVTGINKVSQGENRQSFNGMQVYQDQQWMQNRGHKQGIEQDEQDEQDRIDDFKRKRMDHKKQKRDKQRKMK